MSDHLDDTATRLLDNLRRAINRVMLDSPDVSGAMAALEDLGFEVEMAVDLALYKQTDGHADRSLELAPARAQGAELTDADEMFLKALKIAV